MISKRRETNHVRPSDRHEPFPTMAYNWGKSDNKTPAEKMRKNHGAFRIPYPRGKTVAEQPFGLILSGNMKLDYERIQIRIAAMQNGLKVFPEAGGRIEPPKPMMMGPPPSKAQERIMEIAKYLDTLWYCNFRDSWFRVTHRPVGCVPSLYKDAATIQGWMYADIEKEKNIVKAQLTRLRQSKEKNNKQQPSNDIKLDEFFQPWAMEELEKHGQLTIRKRKPDDTTSSHDTRDIKRARNNETDKAPVVREKASSADALGDEKNGPGNAVHDIGHKSGDTQNVSNNAGNNALVSSFSIITPERVPQNAHGTAMSTANSVQDGIYKSGGSLMSFSISNNATPVSNPAPTPQTHAPYQHPSLGFTKGADLFEFACGLSQEELMGFISDAAAENEQEKKQKEQAGR